MKLPRDFLDDSPSTRAVYSRAACIYRMTPEAVAFPGNTAEMLRAFEYARERMIPVTMRGGGSGLAGQTVGRGIVTDHSRFMRKAEIMGPEEAVVEMGVVLAQLNRALAVGGLVFPPDPSSQDFCTIGGMIANNSKGARSVKYGGTLEWLNWVEVILSDGTIVKVENRALPPEEHSHGMLRKAALLIENNRDRIIEKWPRSKANTSGYNLKGCLGENGKINLLPLFAGSEGTLGIFARASLRMTPLREFRSLAIAEFSDAAEAAEATLEIVPHGPSACELLDRTFIEMVRKGQGGFPIPVSDGCGSILIIEADGTTREEADGTLRMILKSVSSAGKFAIPADASQKEKVWAFRKAASPLLNRGRGKLKSVRFIEDGAVPTENIPAYVRGVTSILRKEGIEAVIFGHSGDGNFHVNPLMDLTDPRHFGLVPVIAEETARLIASLGGSLAGEHGDGRLRTPYLRIVYGGLVDLFINIKKELDPGNMFNPGIIACEDPAPITEGTRFSPSYERTPLRGALSSEKWSLEIERCHGCGTCRDFCPTAQATGFDPLSSRGRAHLLQAVMDGSLAHETLGSSAALDIFDSCLNCSECAVHCPTGVDISPISSLILGEYSGAIRKARNKFFTSFSSLPYKLPGAFLRASAPLTGSRAARILGEKMTGLRRDLGISMPDGITAFDPGKLYRFEGNTGKKAVLFYGCYGNIYNREGETLAAVRILQKLGVEVIVPPQACCGVSKLSKGLFDSAAGDVLFTQNNFLPYLEGDARIVFTAPSCALAVMKDHPAFFPSESSEKMAERAVCISEFLADLLEGGGVDLRPLDISFAYQTPCHAAAIDADEKDMRLLKMIPSIKFAGKTKSCCGMGGTYGIRKENAGIADELGKALGKELELLGADVVVTPCGSCRMQSANLTKKKILHPLELFAMALGVTGE